MCVIVSLWSERLTTTTEAVVGGDAARLNGDPDHRDGDCKGIVWRGAGSGSILEPSRFHNFSNRQT
jgi:hypothetical protein